MKILECKTLENWLIDIISDQGKQGLFDVKPYLGYEAFQALKNPLEFQKISNGSYFVEWSCGADLSADTIEAKWFDVKDISRKAL